MIILSFAVILIVWLFVVGIPLIIVASRQNRSARDERESLNLRIDMLVRDLQNVRQELRDVSKKESSTARPVSPTATEVSENQKFATGERSDEPTVIKTEKIRSANSSQQIFVSSLTNLPVPPPNKNGFPQDSGDDVPMATLADSTDDFDSNSSLRLEKIRSFDGDSEKWGVLNDSSIASPLPKVGSIDSSLAPESSRTSAIAAVSSGNFESSIESERRRSFDQDSKSRTASISGLSNSQESSRALSSLELQIGRKVLGWVAAFLFVLGSAFFIQLAVRLGWLNPLNRLIGMFLLSGTFLGVGFYYFRRGWKRFSEMMTGTGIVILILTAYYGQTIRYFIEPVSDIIFVGAIFGGFFLAGLYRSSVLGFVGILGGLAVPLLIRTPGIVELAIYLTFFNAAVVLVLNQLKRSRIGIFAFAGSAFLFWQFLERFSPSSFHWSLGATLPATNVDSILLGFILAFWGLFQIIWLVDSYLAVFRASRTISFDDLARCLLTPLVFWFGIWRTLSLACFANVEILFVEARRLFEIIDGSLAFAFFILYLITSLVFVQKIKRLQTFAVRSGDANPFAAKFSEPSIRAISRKICLNLSPITSILTFTFLLITIPLTLNASFVAPIWLTLATGLLYWSVRFEFKQKSNKLESESTSNPAIEDRPPAESSQSTVSESRQDFFDKAKRNSFLTFNIWANVFFAFGLFRLWIVDLWPRLFPLSAFLNDSAIPLLHSRAFPTTYSSVLLLAGCWIVFVSVRRYRNNVGEQNPGNRSRTFLDKLTTATGVLFGTFGLLSLLILLTSETYSFVSVFAYRADRITPGIWGWFAVKTSWTILCAGLFVLGYRMRSRFVRTTAQIVATILLTSFVFCDFWFHPVWESTYSMPNPVSFWNFGSENDAATIRTLTDLTVPQYSYPIGNPFAFPNFLLGILAIVGGITIRQTQFFKNFASEYRSGLDWGIAGLTVVWLVSSLECFAYFRYRPDLFGETTFYSIRSVWLLWVLFELLIYWIGTVYRSLPIRRFVYFLATVQLSSVAILEYLIPTRLESLRAFVNLDSLSVLVFAVFLIGTAVWIKNVRDALLKTGESLSNSESSRSKRPTRRVFGLKTGFSILGESETVFINLGLSLGIILIWLVLSGETYRYFSGKTWLGPEYWTRITSLSILWAFMSLVLAVGGIYRRVRVLRVLAFGGIAVWFGKILFCELWNRGNFATPFFNVYSFEILFFGAFVIVLSLFGLNVVSKIFNAVGRERLLERDRKRLLFERKIYFSLIFLAILTIWFGSSNDLYRSIRLFPDSGRFDRAFLAQSALSILWSLFAGVLLAIGFWRRFSPLRWLAIGLFGITTLKVLTVDLTFVDQIYRVGAFFGLALVLTFAAAAYQRFRPGS